LKGEIKDKSILTRILFASSMSLALNLFQVHFVIIFDFISYCQYFSNRKNKTNL